MCVYIYIYIYIYAELLVETIAKYVGRLHVHLTDGKLVDCQQRREVSEIEPERRVAEAVPLPPAIVLGPRPPELQLEVVMPGAAAHQADEVHVSHRMRRLQMTIFCDKCGSYSTSRRSAGLVRACPRIAVGFRAVQLRRLLDGQHPASSERA